MSLNGNDDLIRAAKKLDFDLVDLVAETALWAPSEYVEQMRQKKNTVVMYPNIRRKRIDEERGSVIGGIKFDDNTYANTAIKRALGIKRTEIEGYTACHIWPDTCYDERFHTAIPNLVLLPSAIAGLSDFFDNVIQALQFRSFEIYGWYPEGKDEPTKPANYPINWQEPRSFSSAKTIRGNRKNQGGNTGDNNNKLILEFEPSDENKFMEDLLETHKAERTIFYGDRTETTTWNAGNMTTDSDLRGNILSHPMSTS
jgi:hypothetical protein